MTTAIHPARTVKRPSVLGAVASIVQALVVIGGVPYALIRFVGWPLPHTMPSITTMKTAWELHDFSDRLLIGGLACAVWICWALTMISLVAHTVGQVLAATLR